MADILPDLDDDDLFFDTEAATRVGLKVLEMCDRLLPMHRIVPGSQAKWYFEIDEVRYALTASIVEPLPIASGSTIGDSDGDDGA